MARHTIGWSGKNLERQVRGAKTWKEGVEKLRIGRQDVDHVYGGRKLDDVETRIKVAEFLDRTMWCRTPRLRDRNGEALLLRRGDGRFYKKLHLYRSLL